MRKGDLGLFSPKSPAVTLLAFMHTAQTAAVCMFLSLFRFCILPFEVGERYVQRFMPEANSDGVQRNAFFMERVGVGLAEAVELCGFDAHLLCNCLHLRRK
jgi:hypothetical protein